jgi:transcriptional regulator with XRE-family HTH domain
MYFESHMAILHMEIQERIGTRIRELRTDKNLTQEALAWKSDVDRTFMNHVEKGKRNISIKSLEKIVEQGLEMSLKKFFDDKTFA